MKMRKINNKKGSHVGIVVSFVIFVTFLVFLYTIIQPVTVRERSKDYVLEYLTLNLIGNSTGNMTTMIIDVTESTGNQDCLNMQDFPEVPESERNNLLIKNSSDFIFPYEYRGNEDVWIQTGTNFIGILKVYFGSDLEKSPLSTATGCNPRAYTVGYVKTFSEIFETKMVEMNETYYADYEGLKAYLGIPPGTEFNFYIYDSQRSEPPVISAENQEPPTDRSVFVEETPIQYSDENGNKLFGFLVVKIW